MNNSEWLARYVSEPDVLPWPLAPDDPLEATDNRYPQIALAIAACATTALQWKNLLLNTTRDEEDEKRMELARSLLKAVLSWQQCYHPAPSACIAHTQSTKTLLPLMVHTLYSTGSGSIWQQAQSMLVVLKQHHPDWQLAAVRDLISRFADETSASAFPRQRTTRILLLLDLSATGLIAELHLESHPDGLEELYADPSCMAFFDPSDKQFQSAIALAWEYVQQKGLCIHHVDVCWKLTAHPVARHPSTSLERVKGNSIGAAFACGLVHTLDLQRRPLDLARSRWAITGAIIPTDYQNVAIGSVGGYLRKLEAAASAYVKVIVPDVDLPTLRPDWEYRLPSLEGARSLEHISEIVSTYTTPTYSGSHLPPYPTSPPDRVGFVGRTDILQYYFQQLLTTHCAVLVGPAGIGKTMLAAVLARELTGADKIFWHRCQEQEDIGILIWELAVFLAWHGYEDVWRQIQADQKSGGRFYQPERYMGNVLRLLQGQGYVLCLDDIQHTEQNLSLCSYIEHLLACTRAGTVHLIITTRKSPWFLVSETCALLPGFTLEDTLLLCEYHKLGLSPDEIAIIHAHLQGNPLFLTLTINALMSTDERATIINRLLDQADLDSLTRFLNEQADEQLSEEEREVMHALSILPGSPGTRKTIEFILDSKNIQPVLDSLSLRSLLRVRNELIGKSYEQHDLLRIFYYNRSLDRKTRQSLHRRAGEYFCAPGDEFDPLRAAYHYLHAQDYTQAIAWLTSDVRAIINTGQTAHLHHQLMQLDIAWNVVRTRICLGMSTVFRYSTPRQASRWIEEGFQHIEQVGSYDEDDVAVLKAHLHHTKGSMASESHNYSLALQHLEQSIQLLEKHSPREQASPTDELHADILLNIANVYCEIGRKSDGITYYQKALDVYKRTGNVWAQLAARHNLAIEKRRNGEWDVAIAEYHRVINLAQDYGGVMFLVQVELSLGIVLTNQGNNAEAHKHLEKSIALARQYHLTADLVAGLASLSDLQIRERAWDAAATTLKEAEHLVHLDDVDANDQVSEIYRGWAQVHLAAHQIPAAMTRIVQALLHDRTLGDTEEEAKSLRVQGIILAAEERYEAAMESLEQSLAQLQYQDRYEAGRTQMELGHILLMQGAWIIGLHLLQETRDLFQQLGAKRDLALVDDYIASYQNNQTT